MTAIFLSYRRADTSGYAGRLTSALQEHFGEDQVFHDIETIQPGRDFRLAIDQAISRCRVLLVLIGDTWLTETGEKGRRLDDPSDYVRLEIATALRQGIPVLPVLVEGMRMPQETQLPAELQALASRQALELSDSRWDYDVQQLVGALGSLIGVAAVGRRNRAFWWAVTAALSLAIAAGSWWMLNLPAQIGGVWKLPNGSQWIVSQQGNNIGIEEVHYQTNEVWKRGQGELSRRRGRFSLRLVFQDGPMYQGKFRVSEDGKVIRGEVFDPQAGRRDPFVLIR